MPRKTYTTKLDFDEDYDLNAERDGHPNTRQAVRLNYNRHVMYPISESIAANLVRIFAWPLSTRIMFVGAGFAWTAEALEVNHGYNSIVTLDTSPWIQANQDTNEEVEINAAITAAGLNPFVGEGAIVKAKIYSPENRRGHSRSVMNEDLSNNGSRNRVRNVLGNIDVGITEHVAETLNDSEITTLAARIDAMNASIQAIHLISELGAGSNQNPVFNWKILADWKALVPSHTWISLNSWEVL